MAVIAVLGGTGNVGRTIVDGFKNDGNHEVIVFGRKASEEGSATRVVAVDYTNVEQLTQIMEENNVHTVISTIVMYYPDSAQAERNAIAAASKSSSTKRFVASNWGNAAPEDHALRTSANTFRLQSEEALKATDLEWTQFYNGHFLDYFGKPFVNTYLPPLVWAVDIANKTAALPGAGENLVAFTHTKDLAKFVVASQSLPKWERVMQCYSDRATTKQIVEVAEEVTGSKFNVTYDPVEKLRRGEVTELPSHVAGYQFLPKDVMQGLLSLFSLWAVNDQITIPEELSLNKQFPEISTTTVKQALSVWRE